MQTHEAKLALKLETENETRASWVIRDSRDCLLQASLGLLVEFFLSPMLMHKPLIA